ncbi:MAG: AAA family ATPase [Pirellulaceae bacterium]|nr:AAA family ATPase [Pirellulaceae bacterium]
MSDLDQFVKIDFERFKALRKFTLKLRHFNVLVGPNNAGKSTVLAAFRILAMGLRKAYSRKPERVDGPNGPTHGYRIDVNEVAIAEENLFYNYDDAHPATVRFRLSNGNSLQIFIASQGSCTLIPQSERPCLSPSTFRKHFNCRIGFAPILGPVEHNELLFDKDAARRALFNYSASRNFRNIWHHYPDRFEEFRETLVRTWPGMDIQPPEVQYGDGKPKLFMFCPEERIPREIFWAGFGFQVWCQMLTHVIQSADCSLFLIDEPDIYLHSDLQRQLLALLRNLGPDIVMATHSTEIITEAEPDDIVLIDKRRASARRIKDPSQLSDVFRVLGSNLNPILTQLAKTRAVVFVEGKDFQVISRLAQKLGADKVGNRSDFAVVPVEGFNPQRVKSLKHGMETTLGSAVRCGLILDRDYRCDAERKAIEEECRTVCCFVSIHQRKEIENFLLVPDAVNRAAARNHSDRCKRSGRRQEFRFDAHKVLEEFAVERQEYVLAQYLANRRRYERACGTGSNEALYNEEALREFNKYWKTTEMRLAMLPGKDALSHVNRRLQDAHQISVTPTGIIDAMKIDEIPEEMKLLIGQLRDFTRRGDHV